MSGIYDSIASAGQKVSEYMASVVNQASSSIEQFRKDGEVLKNSFLPGGPEIQAKIGEMCDGGYGQYYVDAFVKHSQGETIHPDSLAVLSRFGLADERIASPAPARIIPLTDNPLNELSVPRSPVA